MSLPPFEIPGDATGRPSYGRPFVWLILAALFVFLIASTLYGIAAPDVEGLNENQRLTRVLKELQTEYTFRALPGRLRPRGAAPAFLAEIEQRLKATPIETRGVAGRAERAVLILRQELSNQPPNFADLNAEVDDIENEKRRFEVARARSELNGALRDLYSSEELTREEAEAIIHTLREYGEGQWPYPLAIQQARDRAGMKDPTGQLMIGVLGLGVLVAGIGMWGIYIFLAASGRATPIGVPLKGASVLVADSLGARMLIFLGAFLFIPVLIFAFSPEAIRESLWARTVGMALVLVVALVLSARSIFGEKISLADIGLKSRDLGQDILWGLGGWLANWPIIIVLLGIGLFIAPYVPSADHPVSEQILQQGAFIPLLIQAAVFAPLMEEFFFRGCLYQGLQLRLKSVFWPVVISSFAFAAIHPQGAAMWLALAWVGAMGALLTRQRGSLIPAIVMHAAHNGSILILSNYTQGLR